VKGRAKHTARLLEGRVDTDTRRVTLHMYINLSCEWTLQYEMQTREFKHSIFEEKRGKDYYMCLYYIFPREQC